MVSKHYIRSRTSYIQSRKYGCQVLFEAGFYIHPDWNTFGFFNVPHLHNFLHKYRLIFNFDVRSFRNIN